MSLFKVYYEKSVSHVLSQGQPPELVSDVPQSLPMEVRVCMRACVSMHMSKYLTSLILVMCFEIV